MLEKPVSGPVSEIVEKLFSYFSHFLNQSFLNSGSHVLTRL
jgi:hypothetical protein